MNDSTEQGGTGEGFQDPTAPTWGTPEPTQPIPSPEPPVTPPSPYAAPAPYAAPQPPELPAAPAPYGQPPYEQPSYGQAPYGQPPYGQAPYGQAPYGQTPYGQAYGQSPYPPPPVPYGAPQQNSGALTLTIVSAIATVTCCLLCAPSLIFGIVALSKQSTDPQASARMTRYGWIAFGISLAIGVVLAVAFVAFGSIGAFEGSTTSDYEGL